MPSPKRIRITESTTMETNKVTPHQITFTANKEPQADKRTAPQSSRFLTFPLEMRLAFYDNCSILSLLILTHTCRTFYLDINVSSKLIQHLEGYERHLLWNPHLQASTRHPLLSAGTFPLTISMMVEQDLKVARDADMRLEYPNRRSMDEVNTFNRVYGPPSGVLRYGKTERPIVQQSLHFLALPLEMRLEIYDNCSLLSLLILTHTCRTTYIEINTRQGIVQRSKGYKRETNTNPHEAANTDNHPLLAKGTIPLTIPMMAYKDQLDAPSYSRHPFYRYIHEVRTFCQVYGTHNAVYGRLTRWTCCIALDCRRIHWDEVGYPHHLMYCKECWGRA
ncbi:hypothetical protein BJ508DRAFT_335264 [Ascobolus immersus RN42]|uniref:F-box domain-containing protein n=1 Tax=Ascobolus immersus RN42 TaxID=1160509 RepID=A0A3N4HJX5_ASCIM|nr:hypothetical protein BJ508DRAFT_335264 [Ascobolus immersus RN42]